MKKEGRQQRILQSAARLFAEKRFDEVLMDEVAHRAGVGKGTLYRYFRDKEELYFAVVFDGIGHLKEQLRSKASSEPDPLKKLEAAVRAIVSFLRGNRCFFRLMTLEDSKADERKSSYRSRWHQERGGLLASIEEVLESGAKRGIFDVRHLNTEAQILLGMVRSTLRFNQDRMSVDEIVEEILRIFLRGIQKEQA